MTETAKKTLHTSDQVIQWNKRSALEKLVYASMLLACMRAGVGDRITATTPAILKRGFRQSLQFFQANARLVPQNLTSSLYDICK